MHKSLYKFSKKRNKFNVTIKSTITKIIINGIFFLKIKKFTKKKQNWGERERERIDIFSVNNLEGIWERGGKEVKRNL